MVDVMRNMLRMTPMSADVRVHMFKVYGTLSTCVGAAAAGSVLQMRSGLSRAGGMCSALSLLSMACLFTFLWLPRYASRRRVAALHAFTFLQGVSLGPLLGYVVDDVDPRLLMTALMATTVVFAGLTVSALFARRKAYLYLGGVLVSALSVLFYAALLSRVLPWVAMQTFGLQLYAGLAVFCGLVLYDTQKIMEQAERGDKDHLRHALELFQDVVAIFVRLLVSLLRKEDGRRRRQQEQEQEQQRRNQSRKSWN